MPPSSVQRPADIQDRPEGFLRLRQSRVHAAGRRRPRLAVAEGIRDRGRCGLLRHALGHSGGCGQCLAVVLRQARASLRGARIPLPCRGGSSASLPICRPKCCMRFRGLAEDVRRALAGFRAKPGIPGPTHDVEAVRTSGQEKPCSCSYGDGQAGRHRHLRRAFPCIRRDGDPRFTKRSRTGEGSRVGGRDR